MCCFYYPVDWVLDFLFISVHIHIYNIALFKSISFLPSWSKLVPTKSVIAHRVARIVGASPIFLFLIVGYTDHNIPILCFCYFYAEFYWLVVFDGQVEDEVSHLPIIADVLHFKSLYFERATVGLLQTTKAFHFFVWFHLLWLLIFVHANWYVLVLEQFVSDAELIKIATTGLPLQLLFLCGYLFWLQNFLCLLLILIFQYLVIRQC